MKKIGVILSGSGFLDGAEIRESVFTILALDLLDVEIKFYAPDINQHHVINHISGEEVNESRNILNESARIARGDIKNLDQLDVSQLDALILPGGFGVAKNLCNFAFKGPEGEVLEILKKKISEFHDQKKPIGGICIAPALLAMIFANNKVVVTIGNDNETKNAIESLGAIHKECKVNEICIDENNKVITTPAYMYGDARPKDIFEGIQACVKKVVEMSN